MLLALLREELVLLRDGVLLMLRDGVLLMLRDGVELMLRDGVELLRGTAELLCEEDLLPLNEPLLLPLLCEGELLRLREGTDDSLLPLAGREGVALLLRDGAFD